MVAQESGAGCAEVRDFDHLLRAHGLSKARAQGIHQRGVEIALAEETRRAVAQREGGDELAVAVVAADEHRRVVVHSGAKQFWNRRWMKSSTPARAVALSAMRNSMSGARPKTR